MNSLRWLLAAALLTVAPHANAAKRAWIDGTLARMDVRQYNAGRHAKTEDHYIYTIDAPDMGYVVNFNKRILKTPINDPIRFDVDGDKLKVVDTDRKERTGKIEQRIRKVAQ